jgi:LysR family transcriptional regulator, transcription activator of glutamate synthase operon
MNLRQLRYLVAIADERHFTRAAAREHVAQPALSQQIRSLEAEVGLPLVERTTRRVAMTQAGDLLVARARRALAELDAAQAELQSLAGVQAGRLSVGAMHTMGPVDLSLLLATFHARYPAVELTVREQSSEELAAMLRDDEIDLAFLSVTERIQSRGLTLRPLVSEELVVALAADHPLASRPRLRLADLAGESFISFREGARLRELLTTAAAGAGFEPRIALESNESRRIRSLVSRGLGVAILPRSDVAGSGSTVAVCDLVEPPLTRDVTLASRAERRPAPAAEAFLALALDVYGGEAPTAAPAAAPIRPTGSAAP